VTEVIKTSVFLCIKADCREMKVSY